MAQRFDPRITPWHIDETAFEDLNSPAERIKFLLQYAVLAPSGHNTQPWRFEVTDRGVSVYADYRRSLPQTDPEHRELLMSIGAAVFNLRVAAAHFGYHCAVMYSATGVRPERVASVDLWEALDNQEVDEDLKELFFAIPLRHTNRQNFQTKRLMESDIESIERIPPTPRATFRLITSARVRSEIAQLIAVGDRIQCADPEYRQEMSKWIRPTGTTEADGLTVDAIGIPPVLGPTAGWFIRHFDFGSTVSTRDYRLAASSPALIIIESEDDFTSLVEAGELLERLLLTVTARGVQYSLVNQTVQVSGLRTQLRRLGRLTAQPQLVLRVGYAEPIARPAPRRPIDDVVQLTR